MVSVLYVIIGGSIGNGVGVGYRVMHSDQGVWAHWYEDMLVLWDDGEMAIRGEVG